MNTSTLSSLTVAALLLVTPLSQAAQNEPAKQEGQQSAAASPSNGNGGTVEAIKGYSVEKRDEALKNAKLALDEIDARINVLEERIDKKWDTMDSTARQQARSTLKSLHEQRVRVAEWYGGLKASTASAWEHMKTGFSEAYQKLRHGWEKAEHDFQKNKGK